MGFPIPIFALDDWAIVWVFPAIMALVFGVFVRDRDVVEGGDRRPVMQRFLSNFVVYGSVWVPFQVVGDAIERGATAQGVGSPVLWGFGTGLASGLVAFVALMAVAATTEPVGSWLSFKRNPFKSAGKS